jgi:hypothetical protein
MYQLSALHSSDRVKKLSVQAPFSTYLQLEHGVLVGDLNEGIVAAAALVCHAGQVGVALLSILTHRQGVIVGIGGEEVLRVVVGVNNDLA